jgi:O-antigen/teichoic acid export membrane protein
VKILERVQQAWKQTCASTLARNTGWMFLGQGFNAFLLAGYFIVLSRLLGVREYGILAGCAAFVMIVSPYGSLGSGMLFMRYVTTDQKQHKLYFGNILLSTMVTASILVVGLGLSASHVLHAGSTAIVFLLAISECFCSSITFSLSQIFQTYEMPRRMALVSIACNLLRLGAALILWALYGHATARQWALANLGASLALCALTVIFVIWQFGFPRFSFRLFLRRAVEGSSFSLAGSATSIYNDFDKTLLSHYGMFVANGIYSVAYRVVNVATMPSYSIEMAAIPRFFQHGANGFEDLVRYGNRLLKRSLLIGLLMTVALWGSAPLLPLFIGRGFAESVLALRWLALLPLLRSAHLILGSVLTAAGFQHYRTAFQLAIAGFNFALNLWLIPYYNWQGAAWASLATDGLLGVFYGGFICWHLHFRDHKNWLLRYR